jgi:hypothetical protein
MGWIKIKRVSMMMSLLCNHIILGNMLSQINLRHYQIFLKMITIPHTPYSNCTESILYKILTYTVFIDMLTACFYGGGTIENYCFHQPKRWCG